MASHPKRQNPTLFKSSSQKCEDNDISFQGKEVLCKIWTSSCSNNEEHRVLEYDVTESVSKFYFSTSVNVQKPTQFQIKISDNLKKLFLPFFTSITIINTCFVCVALAITKTAVYEEKQRQHIKIRK
jgi:hypothetical protein